MTQADPIERRISLLRFVMIFGVVLLHTPPYTPIAETGPGLFDAVVAFFQHAVFRSTVPVLTLISGYLLYRSAIDQYPARLLRKKVGSILVPFLFFNLTLLGAYVLLVEVAGLSIGNTRLDTIQDWLNAAFGLTASPINYPLNFLRDLMALFILAPLLGWFLRRAPWPGLVLVLLVFQFNLDGMFVLRNVMLPIFYIGGMAAVLKWDMRALDRYAPWLLALFVILCAAIVHFRVENTNYFRLVAPILIWPAASLLVSTGVGRWLARMSRYSYFLFLAHAPVLLVVSVIYKHFSAHIPFPVYWVLTPVVVTGVLVATYKVLARLMPATFNTLIGNAGPRTVPNPEAALKKS